MAEADPTKGLDIIKVGGTADDGNDFEDLGHVSDTLLSALSLQPGQFAPHENPPKTLFKNCPPLRRSGEEFVQKLLKGIFSARLAAAVVSK